MKGRLDTPLKKLKRNWKHRVKAWRKLKTSSSIVPTTTSTVPTTTEPPSTTSIEPTTTGTVLTTSMQAEDVCCRTCQNWSMTVSERSAAMSLRCDWICNDHFIANFVLSLAMKEFWKSINISWSYRHKSGVLFFWLTLYNYVHVHLSILEFHCSRQLLLLCVLLFIFAEKCKHTDLHKEVDD